MKCPFCGSEMIKGYMRLENGIGTGWNDKIQNDEVFFSTPAKLEFNPLIVAHNCSQCQKIVIDYYGYKE